MGHHIVGTGIYLLFQVHHIGIQIGRFKMFLRVTGHPHAKIEGSGVFHILIQVFSCPQVHDLFNQFIGMSMSVRLGTEHGFIFVAVATQCQHIIDTHEVEIDQHVLSLAFGKTSA